MDKNQLHAFYARHAAALADHLGNLLHALEVGRLSRPELEALCAEVHALSTSIENFRIFAADRFRAEEKE